MQKKSYLDTSVLLSTAFGESVGTSIINNLSSCDEIFSNYLLLTETASSFKRENISLDEITRITSWVNLISIPIDLFTIQKVLSHGYVRGADLHHLCTALIIAGKDTKKIIFASLDIKQLSIAKKLGFKTWDFN